MPRIELSSSKGLVQLAGQGFIDKDYQSHAASLDISVAGSAAEKGAIVHIVTAAATLTLPKASAGATAGQIKIVISTTADDVLLKTYASDNDADGGPDTTLKTLTNIGDFAICVFNGTTWVAGTSLA